MGPPRVRRPLSASRFYEGSMNDRASAAPPPNFLGPEERARLEKPLRPMSDDWADKQVKKGRLLGQVWEGVRGRLRFRRDGAGGGERGKSTSSGGSSVKEERVGREEVMANYQQLVASGFFSSTAIQSARQPGPMAAGAEDKRDQKMAVPTPKPSSTQLRPTKDEVLDNYHQLASSGFFSSHATYGTRPQGQGQAQTRTGTPAPSASPTKSTRSAPVTRPPSPPRRSHDTLHPRWHSRSTTPSTSRAPSPMRSPGGSLSSRGTKRAAAAAVDILCDEHDKPDAVDDGHDADKENDAPTPKKMRLRKSASRDIALPKLRNVASRRTMLTRRRSVSSPNADAGAREHGNLARRVLGRLPGGRGSVEVPGPLSPVLPLPEDGPAPSPVIRRCASGQGVESRKERVKEAHTRILRSRKSANEGLYVVPDAQRGIPSVPAIPSKFTYGEDRENDRPWRGLRR